MGVVAISIMWQGTFCPLPTQPRRSANRGAAIKRNNVTVDRHGFVGFDLFFGAGAAWPTKYVWPSRIGGFFISSFLSMVLLQSLPSLSRCSSSSPARAARSSATCRLICMIAPNVLTPTWRSPSLEPPVRLGISGGPVRIVDQSMSLLELEPLHTH